jgi:hypothetical protein
MDLGQQDTMSNGPDLPAILGAIIGAIAPPRRPEPRDPRPATPQSTQPQPPVEPDIVDRRDEGGVKHRGDFPNPSGGSYKGCF